MNKTKSWGAQKISFDTLCFEVTRRCNMACAHCLRGNSQEMDITQKIIDLALQNVKEVNTIVFTGGEPTLNLEAIQYVLKKCKEENIFVSSFYVVTNGKEVSFEFLKTMLDWYVFCIERGGEPEMCGLALSKDDYHEEIPTANECLLRSLAFFREDKFQRGSNKWVFAEGRGENLPEVQSKVMDYIPELYMYEYAGDDFVQVSDVVYVSADGRVVAGCDWSFDNQAKHQLGTVYDSGKWMENLKTA